MNRKQVLILVIAGAWIGWRVLFPPWATWDLVNTDGQGQIAWEKMERRFINDPPQPGGLNKEPVIRWNYVMQEVALSGVVAAGLCFFLRTRKSKTPADPEETPSSGAAF